LFPPIPIRPRPDAFAVYDKELARSVDPQVAILRDQLCAVAFPLRQISFSQRLQTPRNPPEQMLPVRASRLFPKYLPILLAQVSHSSPA